MSVNSTKFLNVVAKAFIAMTIIFTGFLVIFTYSFFTSFADSEDILSGKLIIIGWLIALILFIIAYGLDKHLDSRATIEDLERDLKVLEQIDKHHNTALASLSIFATELKLKSMRDDIIEGPVGEQKFVTDFAVHYSLCLGSRTLFEKFDWLVKAMAYINEPDDDKEMPEHRRNLLLTALEKPVVNIAEEWSRAILFYILQGDSPLVAKWAPFTYDWLQQRSNKANFTHYIVSSVFLNLTYERQVGRCRLSDEKLVTRIAELTKLTEQQVRTIQKES